jgi:hypothetical protein
MYAISGYLCFAGDRLLPHLHMEQTNDCICLHESRATAHQMYPHRRMKGQTAPVATTAVLRSAPTPLLPTPFLLPTTHTNTCTSKEANLAYWLRQSGDSVIYIAIRAVLTTESYDSCRVICTQLLTPSAAAAAPTNPRQPLPHQTKSRFQGE